MKAEENSRTLSHFKGNRSTVQRTQMSSHISSLVIETQPQLTLLEEFFKAVLIVCGVCVCEYSSHGVQKKMLDLLEF